MGQVQNALLSAAGAVAGAGLAAKKIGRPSKSESASSLAAKKAISSLEEHITAKQLSKRSRSKIRKAIGKGK